jgi:hypothetical protein
MTSLTNPVTPHTVNDALQLSDIILDEDDSREPSRDVITPAGLHCSLSFSLIFVFCPLFPTSVSLSPVTQS